MAIVEIEKNVELELADGETLKTKIPATWKKSFWSMPMIYLVLTNKRLVITARAPSKLFAVNKEKAKKLETTINFSDVKNAEAESAGELFWELLMIIPNAIFGGGQDGGKIYINMKDGTKMRLFYPFCYADDAKKPGLISTKEQRELFEKEQRKLFHTRRFDLISQINQSLVA